MHFVPPPEFCITILLGITVVPRESKTMLIQFFFVGVGGGGGGRGFVVYEKMVNSYSLYTHICILVLAFCNDNSFHFYYVIVNNFVHSFFLSFEIS